MPTEVDIPDVGIVEFPDSMTEGEIAETIRTKIAPRPSLRPAPVTPPGESPMLGGTAPKMPTQAFPAQQERLAAAVTEGQQREQQAKDVATAVETGQVEPAQIGVARSTLPKVTTEELATLLPKGTPTVIPKTLAGLQQGIVSVPEGLMNEWGAAAALAGPVGRIPEAAKAIGTAFVTEMAKSIPQKANEMLSAYKAGDIEGGTRALAELTATAGIVGSVGAKVTSAELAARRAKQMLPYDLAAIENLRPKKLLTHTEEALKTTEAKNAVQIGSPKTLPVEAPPEAGQKMGAQIRAGEEPAIPQKPSGQLGEQVPPKEPLGDVAKPSPVADIESIPATENGGRIAIILPNGKAVVGGRIHADTWNKAIEAGVATDAELADGFAGFVKTDGTAWGVNGKPLPPVTEVFIVGKETPKPPARPDQRPPEPVNKPSQATPEQAPQAAAPTAAAVSEAKPPGAATPEVPPAISETTTPGEIKQPTTPEEVYDASISAFREASRKFRKAQSDFRSKKIGDAEFLAARDEFKLAESTADVAERTFIDAKNQEWGAITTKEARESATRRAEPETASVKVESEIRSVARTEGQRPAKEIKSELVERLEKAIEDAPNEADVRASSYTKANMERVATPDKAETITIEIPGDGTFKIRNTKEALEGILARAKRISTSTTPKASIPKGAIKSSSEALAKQEANKAEWAANLRKAEIGQQRVRLHDAINQSDTEGLIGRTEPEPSVSTEGQTVFKEWRLRKATPQERQDFYKLNRYEIGWIGENRRVTFSQGEGRKEGEWTFNATGKTRADAMRALVLDNMPKEVVLTDPGAKSLHDLEYGETTKPGIVGMGGATPSEFVPVSRTATGIKNAAVDAARAQRGLAPIMAPARVSHQEIWDRTMARIDRDPMWQDNLIAELKHKSRNLSDEEILALDHRMVDLKNEYAKATRDGDQARADGRLADVENAKARIAEWEIKLAELEEIAHSTGSEWGKSGKMRQRLLREDFTLENMEQRARAAKGFKPLTESERAELIRKDAELRRIEAELQGKEQALAEAQMARTMAEMQAAEAKQKSTIPPYIQHIITRISDVIDARANAARERLKGKLFSLSPDVLVDLAEIGLANIKQVGFDFARWSARMTEEIGDRVKPHLEVVWARSKKLLDEITDQVAGKAPKKDRKQAVEEIKKPKTPEEKLAETETKVRTGLKQEDADVNFLARKLARAFYTQGIQGREALIDAVHQVFADVLPDWTRRQTMDAISGYGTVKPLSKDEVSVALRDLKGQMQQLAKLEDMASGKAPLKTGIERRIPSDVEREMIKQVNEAKKRGGYVTTDPNTQLRSALDTVKTRYRNQITELERRLREKDFSKKTKTEIQLDKEALDLQYQRNKVQGEVNKKIFEMALAERTLGQKAAGLILELTNVPRAMQTSLEFSGVLRQGKLFFLTKPFVSSKALRPMLSGTFSERDAFRSQQELEQRPNFPVYKKSGLFIAERGQGKVSQMEEDFRGRIARAIPGIKASERAYVTFLNHLRANIFDDLSARVSRDRVLSLDEAKVLSNFINEWTGRGNMGKAERAGELLSQAFYSPRFVVSRFQTLLAHPIWYGAFSGKAPLKGTGRVRSMIAFEYGKLLGAYPLYVGLAALAFGGTVSLNPKSSDFGKIKIGNTRLDMLAGLSQVTVFVTTTTTGRKTSRKDREIILRGEHKNANYNVGDVLWRFLRTKFAPLPALVVDVFTGEDVKGDKVTLPSLVKRNLTPITYQDVLKVLEDQGIPKGVALQTLGIFGEGVDTYTDETQR